MDKKKKYTWTSRIFKGMFFLAIMLFLLLFVGRKIKNKLDKMTTVLSVGRPVSIDINSDDSKKFLAPSRSE